MRVLITGASSGIGKSIAIKLANQGYDIIAVARNLAKLEELRKYIKTNLTIISKDLTKIEDVYSLYEETKNEDIDILVNSAGIGVYGEFSETSLEKDLDMINLNIVALHILTKQFLKDMLKKDKGYILNVSSVAAFQTGPLMAEYYATKAYVTKLSYAISKELKEKKSNVKVCTLCPGPVDTNFNNKLGIEFSVKPVSSDFVASYAIKEMFKGKAIIIPGMTNKLAAISAKIVPTKVLVHVTYKIQKNKKKHN